MPLKRHHWARLAAASVTLSALLATTAQAGSHDCAARCARERSTAMCASHTTTAAVASVAPTRASSPVWLPEWIGPAPVADVADYSAMYGMPSFPTAPGMIVAIDPETRLPIRPTAAQRRTLSLGTSAESTDLLAPSDAPLLIERLPGGGEIMTLNGHYQMFSVARIGADGRVVTDCGQDAASAKRMLTATSKPRVVRAEKE